MKKLSFVLAILFVIGCEGPQGPVGPAGPPASSLPVFFNGYINGYNSEFNGGFSIYNCPSVPVLKINNYEIAYPGIPQNPFVFNIYDLQVSAGDPSLVSCQNCIVVNNLLYFLHTQTIERIEYEEICRDTHQGGAGIAEHSFFQRQE